MLEDLLVGRGGELLEQLAGQVRALHQGQEPAAVDVQVELGFRQQAKPLVRLDGQLAHLDDRLHRSGAVPVTG